MSQAIKPRAMTFRRIAGAVLILSGLVCFWPLYAWMIGLSDGVGADRAIASYFYVIISVGGGMLMVTG